MKRFRLHTLLLAAGLTAILTISAGAASLGTATVKASALRLRASADTSSAVLTMAYQGDKVEVLEDAGNGWYKVSLKGVTGYMSGEYLKLGGTDVQTAVVAEQTVPAAASPAQGSVKVNLGANEVLNLRSGPSTKNSKIASIPGGTVLNVEETSGDWYKVTYNGKTGYVSASYVVSATQAAVAPMAAAPVSYDSSFGSSVVALARQYIGCPYVYGASGPRSFDCSGFTSFIYKQMGVSIARGASGQYSGGTPVSISSPATWSSSPTRPTPPATLSPMWVSTSATGSSSMPPATGARASPSAASLPAATVPTTPGPAATLKKDTGLAPRPGKPGAGLLRCAEKREKGRISP